MGLLAPPPLVSAGDVDLILPWNYCCFSVCASLLLSGGGAGEANETGIMANSASGEGRKRVAAGEGLETLVWKGALRRTPFKSGVPGSHCSRRSVIPEALES
ncbi:Hypothetical predicted protein [Podarcis lilfordi]|uniref:Uncharacterized protein n=1 Tax=Podarcis lilfordi TaxID=74358 RepID=A0AA35LMM4_9SAUR|nr:Hypothetical predicted protein [Podarcis lilfordi]